MSPLVELECLADNTSTVDLECLVVDSIELDCLDEEV